LKVWGLGIVFLSLPYVQRN